MFPFAGWFIALVDQEEEMRKQEAAHKAKADHDDEERQQQLLEQRVERFLCLLVCLFLSIFVVSHLELMKFKCLVESTLFC